MNPRTFAALVVLLMVPAAAWAQGAPAEEAPAEQEPVAEEKVEQEPVVEEKPEAVEAPAAPDAVVPVIPVEEQADEDAPTEEPTAEEMAEEEAEEVAEPVAEEEVSEEMVEEFDAQEGSVLDENDPRVLKVGDTVHVLPRLPFSGCSLVNYDQYRAVVEEIMNTPDDLEVTVVEEMEVEMSEEDASPVADEEA